MHPHKHLQQVKIIESFFSAEVILFERFYLKIVSSLNAGMESYRVKLAYKELHWKVTETVRYR